GGAEDRVQAGVARHVLADALLVGVAGLDLPAGYPLDQRQRVGPVAVDLVGGAVDHRRVDAVVPDVLQDVEGTGGVDVEVGVGVAHGPVVRRLRRGVHDQGDVAPVTGEDARQRVPVADVHVQ